MHGDEQQNDDTGEDIDTDQTDDGDDYDDNGDSHCEQDQCSMETGRVYDKKSPASTLCIAPAIGEDASTTSKLPAKFVSSFTVENILMGRQNSPCSSASTGLSKGSISATLGPEHSPTNHLGSTSTDCQATPSSSGSTSSSIVGVNWVSHPPVKYTKFTMLSPNAMSSESHKKRKPSFELPTVFNPKSFKAVRESEELCLPTSKEARTTSLAFTSQVTCASSVNSNVIREAVTTVAAPSTMQVYPIASLAELPMSAASPSTTTARLCTLPVVTTLPAMTSLNKTSAMKSLGKSVMGKGFNPSQQYVFIVPSNSVMPTPPIQHMTAFTNNPTRKAIKTEAVESDSTTASIAQTIPCQTPANMMPSRESTVDSSLQRAEDVGVEKTVPSTSTNVLSESNNNFFRTIAPKQNTLSIPSGQDEGTNKPKVSKRVSQKPHKLRFHMTTVVTKQKREPVSDSMRVESPSAAISDVTESSSTSPSSNQEDALERTMVIESAITCSPNMYSAESKPLPKLNSSKKHMPEFREENQRQGVEEINMDSLGMGRINMSSSSSSLNGRRLGKDTAFSSAELISEPRPKERVTRNYTRRKRELTFHLYEEPGAACRAKKACKE